MSIIAAVTGSLTLNGNAPRITIPWIEPVTFSEVENQIRLSIEDQSDLIYQLIIAARETAEAITRRSLVVKKEVLTLDRFPDSNFQIEVPKPPLRNVESIVYINQNGIETLLPESAYRVIFDTNEPALPSLIVPTYGTNWPSVLNDKAAVEITYSCGYGIYTKLVNSIAVSSLIAVPKAIKQWMLLNIANLYEHRETFQIASSSRSSLIDVGTLADSLIANYRIAKW